MMLSITFLDVMNYSPNADNRNSTRIVVVKDRDALDYIGKTHTCILQRFNRGIVEPPDDDEIQAASNAFHNALTVLFLFGPKKFYFASADAYILAQNIALTAYEKGVSTCIVGEVLNSFDTEKGRELQRRMNIPDIFAPQVFVTMGYCEGEYPKRPKRHYTEPICF